MKYNICGDIRSTSYELQKWIKKKVSLSAEDYIAQLQVNSRISELCYELLQGYDDALQEYRLGTISKKKMEYITDVFKQLFKNEKYYNHYIPCMLVLRDKIENTGEVTEAILKPLETMPGEVTPNTV